MEGQPAAYRSRTLAKPRTASGRCGMSTRPSREPRAVAPGLLRNDGGVDATIIGHHLCQTTSCRDSIPVSRLFNALQAGKVSLPLFSERRIRRWRRGQLRGETRGFGRTASCRRRSRFFPRFSIYQCFASRKISLPLLSERRVRRRRCGRFRNEALLSVGARGRPRARIPDVVAWRLPRPYHFRARIQSFQVVAAPFPGNSVRR